MPAGMKMNPESVRTDGPHAKALSAPAVTEASGERISASRVSRLHAPWVIRDATKHISGIPRDAVAAMSSVEISVPGRKSSADNPVPRVGTLLIREDAMEGTRPVLAAVSGTLKSARVFIAKLSNSTKGRA
jgi:hypothetical protein